MQTQQTAYVKIPVVLYSNIIIDALNIAPMGSMLTRLEIV